MAFTRQVFYRTTQPYTSYENRLDNLKVISLKSRRDYYDMCMLRNILFQTTNLNEQITFRNNHYANRHKILFYPPRKRKDFGKYNCPTIRAQNTFNNSFKNIDILNLNERQFKLKLRKKLTEVC